MYLTFEKEHNQVYYLLSFKFIHPYNKTPQSPNNTFNLFILLEILLTMKTLSGDGRIFPFNQNNFNSEF